MASSGNIRVNIHAVRGKLNFPSVRQNEPAPRGVENLLFSLPRRAPFLDVYVDKAKRECGCLACNHPIAKGSYRLSIVVRLPEPRTDQFGKSRTTERYNIHAGCIIEVLEGRRVQTGRSCWDCGISASTNSGHPHRCYTTSRLAYAALCESCARRRRWRRCDACLVFFPPHMVSPVVAIVEDIADGEDVDLDQEICDTCGERTGAKSKRVADDERRRYDELRAKLARGEIFSRDQQ